MILRLKLGTLLCGLAGCLAVTQPAPRVSPTGEAGHGHQSVATSSRESGRYFLGASHDAEHGTLAWLFYINQKDHSGQMFVAPRMLRLSSLELEENGDIIFRTDIFLGRYYRFRGTLHSTEIVGKMELLNSKSGTVRGAWEVRASALSEGGIHAAREGPVPPIHLSNKSYSEAGGDLLGLDVFILPTPRGEAGMVIFYESYWGEGTFTPFAISRVEKEGATIRFQTEGRIGRTGYHLQRTGRATWLLYRDDAKDTKGVAVRATKPLLPSLSPQG
jgi:hypothetical protein